METLRDGTLSVREMRIEDIAPVYALGEKLFTADKWPSLYRTWDEYEPVRLFSSDGEFCLVAEHEEQVIGFALGTLIEKRKNPWKYGYLMWIGVEPAHAGAGVASRLIDALTEEFIIAGARIMIVDTDAENEAAIGFFHRHGFGNEDEHVYMSRNLTRHPDYQRLREKGED